MGYIAPNSEIYLYNNIEFDNSYKDTVYFSNATEQNTYFTSIKVPKYSFTAQQYTRTSRGKIRIDRKADYLYDCNYMRFRNIRLSADGSGDKWFYAFITDVSYINEQVTEVSFEIDIMQTYFFDVVLEDSFVVRQHVMSDNVFENLVSEDIDCGDNYVVANGSEINNKAAGHVIEKNPGKFAVISTKVLDGADPANPTGCVINGVPSVVGVLAWDIDTNGFTAFKNAFDRLDRDNIITAFAFPSELNDLIPAGAWVKDGSPFAGSNYKRATYSAPASPATINGYTPRNYKLFNYPYNLLVASNRQGDTVEYKYELFNYWMLPVSNPTFTSYGVLLPSPFYTLVPNGYRGLIEDFDTAITLSNYPTVPLSRDGFGSWLNQNRSGIMTGLFINTVLKGLSGLSITSGKTGWLFDANEASSAAQIAQKQVPALVPNGLGYVSMPGSETTQQIMPHFGSNFINGVSLALGKYINASRIPNTLAGNFSGSGIIAGTNKFEFVFYQLQIKSDYARIIDSYFDMFGYKINKVTTINRSGRALWNYVKTSGCNMRNRHVGSGIYDGCDSSTLSALQQIYDNGITFWKNVTGLHVGDYSRAAENSLHYTP